MWRAWDDTTDYIHISAWEGWTCSGSAGKRNGSPLLGAYCRTTGEQPVSETDKSFIKTVLTENNGSICYLFKQTYVESELLLL